MSNIEKLDYLFSSIGKRYNNNGKMVVDYTIITAKNDTQALEQAKNCYRIYGLSGSYKLEKMGFKKHWIINSF